MDTGTIRGDITVTFADRFGDGGFVRSGIAMLAVFAGLSALVFAGHPPDIEGRIFGLVFTGVVMLMIWLSLLWGAYRQRGSRISYAFDENGFEINGGAVWMGARWSMVRAVYERPGKLILRTRGVDFEIYKNALSYEAMDALRHLIVRKLGGTAKLKLA
jgi:hypothetical protein